MHSTFHVVVKLTSSGEKAYGWELSQDLEPIAEGVFNSPVAFADNFDLFTTLVAEASGHELENLADGADFSETANQLAWRVNLADYNNR